MTLALCPRVAPDDFVFVMASPFKHFAACEQWRQDKGDGRLGSHGLLDRPIDRKGQFVLACDRDVLDRKRIEDRSHRLVHQSLSEIELAERAAFRNKYQRRNLT